MISLDQQIKKDKDRQHRRYRGDRRDYHHNHRFQEHHDRKNYQSNASNDRLKKQYDDKYSNPKHNTKQLIKVSNLHYAITKEQLQILFSKFGKIKSCRIQWDKMGRSNETATIEFFNRQDQEKAVAQMDGFQLEEQKIKVELFSQRFNAPNKKYDISKQNNTKYKNNRYYRRN